MGRFSSANIIISVRMLEALQRFFSGEEYSVSNRCGIKAVLHD